MFTSWIPNFQFVGLIALPDSSQDFAKFSGVLVVAVVHLLLDDDVHLPPVLAIDFAGVQAGILGLYRIEPEPPLHLLHPPCVSHRSVVLEPGHVVIPVVRLAKQGDFLVRPHRLVAVHLLIWKIKSWELEQGKNNLRNGSHELWLGFKSCWRAIQWIHAKTYLLGDDFYERVCLEHDQEKFFTPADLMKSITSLQA